MAAQFHVFLRDGDEPNRDPPWNIRVRADDSDAAAERALMILGRSLEVERVEELGSDVR